MKGEIRRQEILKHLSCATEPVCASSLSKEFGVSRQIIVKDIARLRLEGSVIVSLSKGYVLQKSGLRERVFKTIHSDEDVCAELNLIVDLGGIVKDVFVYHKVYNKVSASLNIQSRLDVSKFVENITNGRSSLLKNVTSGYHYHTVLAKNQETLDIIEEKLKESGFLAPLQEYEPIELKQ